MAEAPDVRVPEELGWGFVTAAWGWVELAPCTALAPGVLLGVAVAPDGTPLLLSRWRFTPLALAAAALMAEECEEPEPAFPL